MTEAEFDVLVKQALAYRLNKEYTAAWESGGPEPTFSDDHRAWQEKFRSDPFTATENRKQNTRNGWSPRRAIRIALVAALAVIITLSVAWAIVPAIQPHWITQVEPVTFKTTGESADYYYLLFDAETFGIENYSWSEDALPQFKRWSPTWYPKSHGIKLVEEIDCYFPEESYCVQSYNVPNERLKPLDGGEQYDHLTVSYQFLRDGFRCSFGFTEDFDYEIIQINRHPAYVIRDVNSVLSVRHLIWLGSDEKTIFHMSCYGDISDNNMIRFAKSFKKLRSFS